MAEQNSSAERKLNVDNFKQEAPKPYTVPEGYVPPTLGEQWRYAWKNHPAARYGFPAAVTFGLLTWLLYTPPKKEQEPQEKARS